MSRKAESGTDAASVTPDDSNDLPENSGKDPVRAVWIGGAGNLRVNTADGSDVIFVGCLAGSMLPISVTRVYSTSTTATSIVVVY